MSTIKDSIKQKSSLDKLKNDMQKDEQRVYIEPVWRNQDGSTTDMCDMRTRELQRAFNISENKFVGADKQVRKQMGVRNLFERKMNQLLAEADKRVVKLVSVNKFSNIKQELLDNQEVVRQRKSQEGEDYQITQIVIQGDWLAEYGFHPDTKIDLIKSNGELIIRKV